jgi:hypothetical protein
MKRDHIEVLETMHKSGLLSRQAMKSVRGQIMNMTDAQRETYLRRVISRSWERAKEAKR